MAMKDGVASRDRSASGEVTAIRVSRFNEAAQRLHVYSEVRPPDHLRSASSTVNSLGVW